MRLREQYGVFSFDGMGGKRNDDDTAGHVFNGEKTQTVMSDLTTQETDLFLKKLQAGP